ncbi:MAG: ribonuclease Z [Paludibacteraceae bacterium]|nr:ribonuclease Z [Paludibacteraceae bacterium]
MTDTRLQILGSGSAMPTKTRNQVSQVLSLHNKSFMIDCGEATQVQMVRCSVSVSRLNHIFISHLHGDHCFGLVGLISTLGMKSRTADLYIHSHPALEPLLRPLLNFFCRDLSFRVFFEPYSQSSSEILYEDRSLIVSSFPLKHSLPSSGFLFKEKEKERHVLPEKLKFYRVPVKEIAAIKNGADFITDEGIVVPNAHLTTPPSPSISYAYCSDTVYDEKIIPYIEGVTLLYHEATFLHEHLSKAKATMHTTALQAATIAAKANVNRLLIGHFSARYIDTSPLLKEAQSVFPNTSLVEDGAIFDL